MALDDLVQGRLLLQEGARVHILSLPNVRSRNQRKCWWGAHVSAKFFDGLQVSRLGRLYQNLSFEEQRVVRALHGRGGRG
jgi:hypothetical protein